VISIDEITDCATSFFLNGVDIDGEVDFQDLRRLIVECKSENVQIFIEEESNNSKCT
jgi:hypothetical protein